MISDLNVYTVIRGHHTYVIDAVTVIHAILRLKESKENKT